MRLERGLRRALPAVLAALIAVFWLLPDWAGAEFAVPSDGQNAPVSIHTTLFLNSHEVEFLLPGDTVAYRFTPDRMDSYVFRSFPIDGQELPALLLRLIRTSDGQELLTGQYEAGFAAAAQLEAGETYELQAEALTAGGMAVEVMPEARGRCFDNPITLPEGSVRYAKTIVRPRDAHWFSFVAPVSGRYMIRTERSGGDILDTYGLLMDSDGRLIAENDDILFPGDGSFLIDCQLQAGETYLVRISAFSNNTGAYRLALTVPAENQALAESILLEHDELALDVGGVAAAGASASPSSDAELVYASSDSGVVSVEPDGTMTAVSAGTAEIHVFAAGGAKAVCTVTVNPVRVTGVGFESESVSLRAQEQLQLVPVIEPANASDCTVYYRSSDERVVVVDEQGLLTGVAEGEAEITAETADGGFAARIAVRVLSVRPVYRALVLGEQMYEDGVRTGGVNTAQGVADMLKSQSIDGSSYQVRLQLDSTRKEVLDGIYEAFAGAKETDISLFYINCHGGYENGVAYLRLHDDTRITVDQLEAALRPVKGKIVVVLDFCQSGAFIGAPEQFAGGAASAFGGRTPLTSGRYTVITSASSGEDSYRRSFSSADGEASIAAIMGRSLCEGAGWDLIYDKSITLKADADRNRLITVQEIFEYTARRTTHYLKGTGVTQTVYLYPEGDQTVLFGRSG